MKLTVIALENIPAHPDPVLYVVDVKNVHDEAEVTHATIRAHQAQAKRHHRSDGVSLTILFAFEGDQKPVIEHYPNMERRGRK
jgi:hypothetical protein